MNEKYRVWRRDGGRWLVYSPATGATMRFATHEMALRWAVRSADAWPPRVIA